MVRKAPLRASGAALGLVDRTTSVAGEERALT